MSRKFFVEKAKFYRIAFIKLTHFVDAGNGEPHVEVLCLFDDRAFKEVISYESLLSRPAFVRILLHEFPNQVHGLIRHPFWIGKILTKALG